MTEWSPEWPRTTDLVGRYPDGHCGHCWSKPEHQATTSNGSVFCLACYHWMVYSEKDRGL